MPKIILLASLAALAVAAASCDRQQGGSAEANSQRKVRAEAAASPPAVVPASPGRPARGVENPLELVRATYRQYESDAGTPAFPEHAYSERLLALIERDRREAAGGVGRLGFDYWIVGQDYRMTELEVEDEAVLADGNRRVIRASFRNMGTRGTNRFDFVRVGGRWFIDEIRNERRPDAEGSGWVLSELLTEPLANPS